MQSNKHLLLISLYVLIILFAGCGSSGKENQNVVAKIGNDYTVTFNELNNYVHDRFYNKKYKDKSEAYNKALYDLITNQLKRMDFFAKGLENDSDLVQGIRRIINEQIVKEYFDTQYLDKYADEEHAREIYGIMDKQVVYRQIVLYKPENATPEQIDSVKNEAMKIKSEIDEGKEFKDLVAQYSQNKETLKKNGYMPPVDWKQSLSDPVGNTVFHLNKNDVRVLNSNNAFRVVKITDIKKVELRPFNKMKDEILTALKKGYFRESYDQYEKDKKELIDESSLRWNEKALKQLVDWSNIPKFYDDKYKDTFKDAITKGNNPTILSYDKGKVDYKEFLRLLNDVLILSSSKKIREDDIKNFILEAVRTDMIVQKADSLNRQKIIFNVSTLNPVLKNKIVYLYNQAEIEGKIPPATDKALHKFFKENENTLYHQLEKRNIFVMVFPDEASVEKTGLKIQHGTPFEKVTGNYLVKTYVKERDGEIKSYLSDEKPVFGKAAFNMKLSEVSDPIKFEDGDHQFKYAIIKCYHIRPEKQLTYPDVEKTIADDYKNYYRQKIEKKIENDLRSKYDVKVFDNVLKEKLASVGK